MTYSVVCDSRDREAWLAARRSGVGASEAAALMGDDPRCSLVQLWLRKVREEPPEQPSAEYLEWGLRHEPTIIEAYSSERYANRPALPAGQLLRSEAHSWALATLDAWAWPEWLPVHTQTGIPLELKTTEVWHADAWAEGCPRRYWWQLQHQMLVTGAPMASIACLLGVHRLVWCDVERDEEAVQRLIRAGERFWRYVETRTRPPGPMDASSLVAAHPRHAAGIVKLDGSWIEVDQRRQALRKAIDADKRELAAIDDRIRGAIGVYERAVLPNGVTYTARTNKTGARPLRRSGPKKG